MKHLLPVNFDINFYKNYYYDLQCFSEDELIHHYLNHGINENRIYNSSMISYLHKHNKAICLITFQPNEIWCDFLNDFLNYEIFIIIDDNNFDCSYYCNKYNNIHFVKILNTNCKSNGYINMNFTIGKQISSWDVTSNIKLYKSLY
jgi:hypothetical protein